MAHRERDSAFPSVSVVIPAFSLERWSLTERAIESARRQTVQPELVVLCVDNNDELLQRAREHWSAAQGPPVRVVPNEHSEHLQRRRVHERAHGTSRGFGAGSARNTGAAHATGDIIAYIDDDAWAEPNWLDRLLRPYGDPNVVAVGGASLPYYETARPPWFPENFDWVFGCSYSGLPTAAAPLRRLIGANMSVRRSAFEGVGGFHGNDFDDLNLCMRLAEVFGDESLYYTPDAVVHHFVTRQRVTWRYFYRRCYFVNREKVGVLEHAGSAANLKAEREFVVQALRHETAKLLRRGFRGDGNAIRQLGAMATGMGLAAVGYGYGEVRKRIGRS